MKNVLLGLSIFVFGSQAFADTLMIVHKVNNDPNSPSIASVTLTRQADNTLLAQYGAPSTGATQSPENFGPASDVGADFISGGIIHFRSKTLSSASWLISVNFGISNTGESMHIYMGDIARCFQWLRVGLATSISIVGTASATPSVTCSMN
ncbi:MAG: hypothetical protein NDJ89_06200 [Oligoflexia bacterium]|nr:hypothetical protein [Oligoflexia bacterium]